MPISVIKQASLSASERKTANKIREQMQVASALEIVSKYVKSDDPNKRMAVARKVVRDIITHNGGPTTKSAFARRWILKNAVGVIDLATGLQRTYPSTGSNAEPSKGPSPSYGPVKDQKDNPRSRYDFNYCVQRKQAAGLPTDEAVLECNEELGGKSTMGYTDSNTSKNALKTRSAVIERVPAWAVASAGVDPDATITTDNGIRSASSIPSYFYGESIADMMARKRQEKEEAAEAKNRARIKSAQSIPSWVQASCSDLIE